MPTQSDTKYLTRIEAAKLSPGSPPATSVYRWMMDGIGIRRNKTAPRIKLQFLKVGGNMFTTEEWLSDFFRRCTEAAMVESAPVPPVEQKTMGQARRDKRVAAAIEECG